MALSTDVNLPRSHVAIFPDRCVVCQRIAPRGHLRVITGSIGWWTWVLGGFGSPFYVKAPACTACAWKWHVYRLLMLLAVTAITVAVIWLVWPYFKGFIPRGLQWWAMVALALLCAAPLIAFQVFFAKSFDVTAYVESVDYEFRSQEYAIDFAILNKDATWVKIEGKSLTSLLLGDNERQVD